MTINSGNREHAARVIEAVLVMIGGRLPAVSSVSPEGPLIVGGSRRLAAQHADQVHLAMHTEFGVDGRQVVTDCALAHEQVGCDTGDALTVEQTGQHRELAAGEFAELRCFGESGQLLKPGYESGRSQLLGYPQ